ncbi:hypothetical protein J6590_104701 [Homalodisca vitripennis]|nr:hypothetical protein J6590_104701 [Homalodisca vitripennis]
MPDQKKLGRRSRGDQASGPKTLPPAQTKEKSRMTPARLQMGYVRLPENLPGLRISQSGSHRSQKLQDAVGTSPPVKKFSSSFIHSRTDWVSLAVN